MPATDKERQAKRRNHVKDDPVLRELYLEKERKRKAEKRNQLKQTWSKEYLDDFRMEERNRVRAYRNKRKLECAPPVDESECSSPYSSKQSMGKAVKKARSAYPQSPRKRKAVAAAMAEEMGLKVTGIPIQNQHTKVSDLKKRVTEFYLTDDISWQSPGRKDYVIIRGKDENGQTTKESVQSRYMTMSLAEAHSLFKETGEKISRSYFCELRPAHVKLFDTIPHNVCVCTYHENVRLLLTVLKHHTTLTDNLTEFTNGLVCDPSNKDCMTLTCNQCNTTIDSYAPTDTNEVEYLQWQNIDKIEKVELVAPVTDVFKELKSQLKTYLAHVYVKRKQSHFMNNIKTEVNSKTVMLQVDFAENASLGYQDEAQSVHWCHGQATLFTAYAWIDQNINESKVIVSDYLTHNKLAVHKFMTHIIEDLKCKYPDIEEIHIFSDGASSQFKQRFLFSNLFYWEQKFDLRLRWNFLATSHGKGVIDGIGGTVKRSVWRYVKAGKIEVRNARAFLKVAVDRNPGINITFIPTDDILENKDNLEERWAKTQTVPNTQKLHSIQSWGQYHLSVSDTSDVVEKTRVRIMAYEDTVEVVADAQACVVPEVATQEVTIQEVTVQEAPVQAVETNAAVCDKLYTGSWVMVRYDGNEFPGEVTGFGHTENEVKVNVMHQTGRYWKWPDMKDEIFYFREDIVRTIDAPVVCGTRGQFKF